MSKSASGKTRRTASKCSLLIGASLPNLLLLLFVEIEVFSVDSVREITLEHQSNAYRGTG